MSLAQAQQQIVASLTPLPSETLNLSQSLYRFPAYSIKSSLPKPSFDQSTRDGYAVHDIVAADSDKGIFSLIAEIAAGTLTSLSILPGEAARIMTGAKIPAGCTRVVPFELCREEGNQVVISGTPEFPRERFIRFCGQDLPVGRVIAEQGRRLLPDNLLMLAENNKTSVEVHRKPQVVVLCTGSELVSPGEKMCLGQKVSGNGVLLQALVEELGGACITIQTAPDAEDRIVASLETMMTCKPDLILTTGGMGPGKFDLLERVFSRLGGQVLYNRLQVRPGKSTLFGTLAGIPLFALPGPPPAVRLLFHELVAPALCTLQGNRQPLAPLVSAQLIETIPAGKSRHLSLKTGVAFLQDTSLFVRPAGRLDAVNAVLHLESKSGPFAEGETVPVHVVRAVLNG